MDDPFDLDRFVAAQDSGGAYDTALRELRAGRKDSHWMWFVLPQMRGLGRSAAAHRYGVRGLPEARAYLASAVLGPRLRACCSALLSLPGNDAQAVLGPVDARKLRSCLTLFEAAAPDEPLFGELLDRYFAGQRDPATRDLLRSTGA